MGRWFLLLVAVLAVAFAPAPLPRSRGSRRIPSTDFWALDFLPSSAAHLPAPLHAQRRSRLRTDNRHQRPATPLKIRGIGRENVGTDFVGIYKLEGDTLTVS